MKLLSFYEAAVFWLQVHAPASDKLVHTYVGLAIWLGSAWLTRHSLRSTLPLLIVAVCEAANELLDRLAHGSWKWHDTLGDVTSTLFWPILICLVLHSSRMQRIVKFKRRRHHHHHLPIDLSSFNPNESGITVTPITTNLIKERRPG